MAFDYKKYKDKKKSIDISKFLPTGKNADNVNSYIRQRQVDEIMAESAKETKVILADFGMSTSPIKTMAYGARDTFSNLANNIGDSLGRGVGNVIETVKKPFKDAIANKDITEEQAQQKVMEATITKKGVENKISTLNKVVQIYKPDAPQIKTMAEYDKVYNALNKEQKDLVKAEEKADGVLAVAKIPTAPSRFLAGALATGAVSYALERADSDLKYSPKTEAEQLLIGKDDIQRLAKQEDLYGITTRGLGVPAALITMAIIESPFLAGTGLKPLAKNLIQKKVNKLMLEQASQIGLKEIDNIFKVEMEKTMKEIVETGLKEGKLTEEQANILLKQTNSFRVKQLQSPVDKKMLDTPSEQKLLPDIAATRRGGEIQGEGFLMKPEASKVDTRLAKFNNDYQKKLDIFNQKPTVKNLEAVKLSREKYFKVRDALVEAPDVAKPVVKADELIAKTESPTIKQTDIKTDATIKPESTVSAKTSIEEKAVKTGDDIKKLGGDVERPKSPKLSKDVEAKITNTEKEVGDQFKGLPTYNSRKIKVQDERITELMKSDFSSARAMLRGEKEIPDNISPAYLFKKMEDYAEKTGDVKIMRELSRSKIASDVSQGASELRMIAERSDVNPVKIMEDVRNARAKKAAPKNKKSVQELVAKEKKAIKDKARYEVKKAIKPDAWKKFIEEIRC